jgi:diaminohydroxyphosphoribosylaminopyrimidine deaminase / 5-amino-6-(5-phosphoribosylamino)uracil reductase
VSLERALELAERGRGTTHPNPIVGCVLVDDGEVVGEAWHEQAGGPHAEAIALEQAGLRARGATAYVTMEPCSHHGRTPPCANALIDAGVARIVAGCLDPHPEHGGGLERLRAAGVAVSVDEGELGFRCRVQNEAWRTWASKGRPFVVLKLALTLDGRLTVPGERWISGEESRRRVHESRACVDAVAVGMGTFRADAPQLTARDVDAPRQPRRLVFGRGPIPDDSDLELRTGPLEAELSALAGEGVQSLLLEGGPRVAGGFLREDLVDKLEVYVAPKIAGAGLVFAPELPVPVELRRLHAVQVGEDVLLTAYVHEP